MISKVNAPEPPSTNGVGADESATSCALQALTQSELFENGQEESFDRLTDLATGLFEVELAFVAFLDGDGEEFNSGMDFTRRERSLVSYFFKHTIEQKELVVIEDATKDRRVAYSLSAPRGRFRFLAGAPLVTAGGRTIGAFSIVDREPRSFSEEEAHHLQNLADEVVEKLEKSQEVQETIGVARCLRAGLEDPNMLANVLSPDGTLLEANATSLQYINESRSEVVGQPFWETPWWPERIQDEVRQWVCRAATGEYVEYEADLTTPDGDPFSVEGTVRPVSRANGTIMALVFSARDLTDRKQREKKLKDAQERMELTLKHTGSVVYEIDFETRMVQRHGVFEDFFNASPEELPTWDVFAETVVHPDDRSEFIRFYGRLEDGQEDSGTLEYRTCPETGTVRWIRDIVKVEDEEPRRLRGLAQDVTEQKKRNEELLWAKQEAEEASQLKSSMLANMSHEIRTPLTSITGFSEMLGDKLEGELQVFANRIHTSSQRLQRTLESVLHLSKLESGFSDLHKEELSLGSLVEDVVQAQEQQARKKSVTLTTSLPDVPVRGFWNEDAVYRICQNLLENAIKFTPEGGWAKVGVRSEDEKALLEVEDCGIGIESEEVQGLFEAFKQESEGLGRKYEGSGLGLSIVQRLTEALGGEIEVDTQKDEGTYFTVRLPLRPGAEEGS